MRIGILADSYMAAQKIYRETSSITECEVFVLLRKARGKNYYKNILRHLFSARKNVLQLLGLVIAGRVKFLKEELDHDESISLIKKLNLDIGLHKAGVIYRDKTIKAFKLGILNSHIGILPKYRGRCVMEWSILQGDTTGITVFFIDSGVDTGSKIVLKEKVDVTGYPSIQAAKDHLFNLDATLYRKAIELIRTQDFEYEHNDGSGFRYYVMSNLLLDVVEKSMHSSANFGDF